MTTAFNTELLELMPDTVQWEAYTGTDAHGNPTYASAEDVRVNMTITVSRGTSGDQEGTSGPILHFSGSLITEPKGIRPRDRLTTADGAVGYVDTETTYRDAPGMGDYVQELQAKETA